MAPQRDHLQAAGHSIPTQWQKEGRLSLHAKMRPKEEEFTRKYFLFTPLRNYLHWKKSKNDSILLTIILFLCFYYFILKKVKRCSVNTFFIIILFLS
jgi:hypothetical protein